MNTRYPHVCLFGRVFRTLTTIRCLVSGFLLGLFLVMPVTGKEDSVINIRLSYKIILNPKNLDRPVNSDHETVTDSMIADAVDQMNEILESTWRGYRVQLAEVVEIGGLGSDAGNPSRWFAEDFIGDFDANSMKEKMVQEAMAAPDVYAWRKNAINLYVNQGTGGGKWWRWRDSDLIVLGPTYADAGWFHLHEIGHYFNLYHTHGVGCDSRSIKPGDDDVADTILDLPWWDLDEIARCNFERGYYQLTAEEQEQVDNVAENVMSYHNNRPVSAQLTRFTEGQLDRWTDAAAYSIRDQVMDGRTYVVDQQSIGGHGTSDNPFPNLGQAVEVASSAEGNIILARPGTFTGPLHITTPMTLRASRAGAVTIGAKPSVASIASLDNDI